MKKMYLSLLSFLFVVLFSQNAVLAQITAYQSISLPLSGGSTPTQCTDLDAFRATLTRTDYTEVRVTSTVSTQVFGTTNAVIAQAVANALRNATTSTIIDGANTWVTGICGGGVELTFSNIGTTLCQCGTGPTNFSIRPCIGNNNWGGFNGLTCAAAAQTITLQFGYPGGPPPPTVAPIASFSYDESIDTVWINANRTLVNTSVDAEKSYWDIIGYNVSNKNGPYAAVQATRQCKNSEGITDCFIDTVNNAVNFNYTYTKPGYYRLKVTAINEFGFDSYIDTIYVDTPATKPVAEFFADKRIIGIYDFANLYDLSSNGPTSWNWYLRPAFYDPLAPFYNNINPSNAKYPQLNALEGGVYDVCLVVSNDRGSDTMCKPDYVRVISGFEVCKGTSVGSDTMAISNEGSAKLATVGDIYIPNLIGTCSKGFTIVACTDTVTMYMERMRMRMNVTGNNTPSDSLLIRVGNANGAVVARYGGRNIPAKSAVVKVPGGVAYLQTIIVNPTSATPSGDSGYVVRWDAPLATFPIPTANFSIPDTIYDGQTVQFQNKSVGTRMNFAWDTDGDGVFGLDNPGADIDSITTNPSRTYSVFAAYTANLCLIARNCKGADTVCKNVRFLPVTAVPFTDFTVNIPSGFTTDTFRFYDQSLNGPNEWSWSFSPNSVAYLEGTNAGSQNPVVFLNSATAYTVTLISVNQQGDDTRTKVSYVNAIAFGSPGCSTCPTVGGIPVMPSTLDVGITRVVLGSIDTTTNLNNPIYQALFNIKKTTVFRGVSYTLSTARNTAVDPMTTKAWIDFSRSTRFGDAPGEEIINETNQNKVVTTGTFKVPDAAPIGTTRMRIGVSYGLTSLSDQVATLGCFEDYGIEVGRDVIKPTLSLIGSSLEKIEVNKPYVEKGVVANDNLEGDISSKYQVTGFVDINRVGYYTLKYTVADLYDNISDTIIRTVQVEINRTGPTLTLLGNDSMSVEVFNSYTEQGATAVNNVGVDLTSLIVTTGKVDTAVLGTYVLTYSITDQFGFVSSQNRWVKVTDTTKPTILTQEGTSTITHQVGTPYLDPVVVSDNYWKNLSATRTGIINPSIPGSYNLLYNAVDGSGNQAIQYAVTVIVKDLIPPTVILKGDNPMVVDVFTTFVDPGVTATDNYYPFVFPVVTGIPAMNALGNFTVTYTVTDGSGNTTIVTRTVSVVDTKAPEIELLGANPYVVARFATYVDPGVKLKDNYYSDATLRANLTTDLSGLDLTRPGLYFIKYNVTDPSGNKATTGERLVSVEEFSSLAELQARSNVAIYPNPNNGLFNITTKNNTHIKQVKVMDVLGKVILNNIYNATDVAIDLTTMNKGLYMVMIEDENGITATNKVVVE